ncbi:ATP-binding protein [Streptomyces rectiviolaceus]
MTRKPWEISFLAEPEEVAALRRIMRLHLNLWGLPGLIDAAQLCVTELVTNVITHVGPGTPATLAVSMSGEYLRLEIHDPDTRVLPTLLSPGSDAETGRGVALVDAVADRWGVVLQSDLKVTWCELAAGLNRPDGHVERPSVARAETILALYDPVRFPCAEAQTRLTPGVVEEAMVRVVADLFNWLRAHGRDTAEVLDRAQMHFETEAVDAC